MAYSAAKEEKMRQAQSALTEVLARYNAQVNELVRFMRGAMKGKLQVADRHQRMTKAELRAEIKSIKKYSERVAQRLRFG